MSLVNRKAQPSKIRGRYEESVGQKFWKKPKLYPFYASYKETDSIEILPKLFNLACTTEMAYES